MRRALYIAILSLLFAPQMVWAQTANMHLLVSTEWLASHLDSGVVVIHVGRDDDAYREGHLPGARFLSLGEVATTLNGIPNMFPPLDRLAETFRALGVGEEARIVIYGDDPGIFAARAWVAFDVLGHGDRAALVDGGIAKWRVEGRPLSREATIASPLPFTPRPAPQRLVDARWIREHLADAGVVLVDARPSSQYAGTEPGTGVPPERAGHIVGARSLYWMRALSDAPPHVMRPLAELRASLWEPIGAAPARIVVTYCRTGMQASHAYFQARYVGYDDVRMYDGSFIEWAHLPTAEHPVSGRR